MSTTKTRRCLAAVALRYQDYKTISGPDVAARRVPRAHLLDIAGGFKTSLPRSLPRGGPTPVGFCARTTRSCDPRRRCEVEHRGGF